MTPGQLLTPEQQESLRQANRANARLERIWSVYAISAIHDTHQDPEILLRRAEEIVDVWMVFDDSNRIDTTQIMSEAGAFLGKMLEGMKAFEARKEEKPE